MHSVNGHELRMCKQNGGGHEMVCIERLSILLCNVVCVL